MGQILPEKIESVKIMSRRQEVFGRQDVFGYLF